MRRVNEEDLRRSLLKVIEPYEGSAFMVGPDLAISCVHVCVPEGVSPASSHKVDLLYQPDPKAASVSLHGKYLPDQSDPEHDLAVVRVELPADLHIPPAPLSGDDQQREKVVAFGFPNGQPSPRRVPGVIDPIHYTDAVCFEDGWTCPVLHIDTKGQGFWSDRVVRPGMSGGPIWNERTGTVVALVEGRKPRGYTPGDMPEGYGIPVKHLHARSPEVGPLLQRPARVNWRKILLPVVLGVTLVLAFVLYQLLGDLTPLEIRVAVMKQQGDTVSVLKSGDVLTSENHYKVFFQPARETYVYVLQQDAAGKVDVLFPNQKWTPRTNPVPGGRAVWVPNDLNTWFYLDEHVGREAIIVVATRERNQQLEAIVHSLVEGEALGPLAAWLSSPDRGVAGARRVETKPVPSPDGRTMNLETVLVRGSGVDFIHKVEFEHK